MSAGTALARRSAAMLLTLAGVVALSGTAAAQTTTEPAPATTTETTPTTTTPTETAPTETAPTETAPTETTPTEPAPEEVSGVDAYVESIPTTRGSRPSSGAGSGGPTAGNRAVEEKADGDESGSTRKRRARRRSRDDSAGYVLPDRVADAGLPQPPVSTHRLASDGGGLSEVLGNADTLRLVAILLGVSALLIGTATLGRRRARL
jgi:hypothetical protein